MLDNYILVLALSQCHSGESEIRKCEMKWKWNGNWKHKIKMEKVWVPASKPEP